MTEKELKERKFYRADQEADFAKQDIGPPQTLDPAYRLAFQDKDFLLRQELRPVRFQLELLKTEMLLDEANIASTFVMYGSARIPSPERADAPSTARASANWRGDGPSMLSPVPKRPWTAGRAARERSPGRAGLFA